VCTATDIVSKAKAPPSFRGKRADRSWGGAGAGPLSSESLLKSEGRFGTAVAAAAICCCRGLLRYQDPPVFSYLSLDRTRPCVGLDASRARRRHHTMRTNHHHHRHLRRRRTFSAPDECSTPFRCCCRPPPPSGRDCASPSLEGVGSPSRGRRRSAARRARTSKPRTPRSHGTRRGAPAASPTCVSSLYYLLRFFAVGASAQSLACSGCTAKEGGYSRR
jgi:hypothetical protein